MSNLDPRIIASFLGHPPVEAEPNPARARYRARRVLTLTQDDLHFLRGLRISVEGEQEVANE